MEKQESHGNDGLIDLLTTAVASTVAAVSNMWNAMTKDGTLAAAGRQGADELGMVLRAFPESVHVDEPGTILNPTQGEIAADRSPLREMHNRAINGTQSHLPSPSEIARDKQPYVPEMSRSHEHEHEMGRG